MLVNCRGARGENDFGRQCPDQFGNGRPRVSITPLSFDPNLYALDGLPHSSEKDE